MGYAVARFTGTVDQNLLCSICSSVLEDAVLTPCGHSFCHMCLHTWIQVNTLSKFFFYVFGGHIHRSYFGVTGTPVLDFW